MNMTPTKCSKRKLLGDDFSVIANYLKHKLHFKIYITILRCKILFLFILLTYHGQTTFCSGNVEKICPLKAFSKEMSQ